MKCPPILSSESERLRALSDYGFASEAMLDSLDPVVRIAARMFSMPVAAVNMIGSDHVFFAAKTGGGQMDMRRDVSFCAHAIAGDGVMVVPDARQDERFHDNPLVTGDAQLRFYAGVPLLSPDGLALGALCVIDTRPRGDFSRDDQDRLRELARMASDRLELRRMEVASDQVRPAFADYAGGSSTPVLWFDDEGHLLAWNGAAAGLYGYGPDDNLGRPVDFLIAERERAGFRALLAQATREESLDAIPMPHEVEGLRRDGSEFPLSVALFCWKDKGRLRFEAVLRDMTRRREEADELRRLANFDPLTGLANRRHFYRRVEEVLLRPDPAAVLLIDLDGFKDVNDTLGHQVGDIVLRDAAVRMLRFVGPDDVAARIGGDEFALLLTGVTDVEQASAIAQKLIDTVAAPVTLNGHDIRIGASCGVALAPLHSHEALELIGNADLALYKAKGLGRGCHYAFVPDLRHQAVTRHLYGMELHRAVDQGEFVLFYQPQISLADGTLSGAEALLRWRHPQRGLLSPASFLPVLESSPLALAVGFWVLDEACAQAAFWRRHGAPVFRIGVNLFAAQFRVDTLVSQVMECLHRHGLPPQALELEVTENIALANDGVVLDTVCRLRDLGVGIAFDDFGTGYASLSLLKTYPLSRIKIDQSFVQGMLDSERDASVVRAILDMARTFGMETIAEGIETEGESRMLRHLLCQEGQGYLFGRPMAARDFETAFALCRPLVFDGV